MTHEAYVLLDANILLHFQPPDQIDWPALTGARHVFLVVYPLLRKELSKAKDMHPSKSIRKRAGEREAWLRERLSSMDRPIRPGVFLYREAKEPRALVEQLGLDKDVSDDLIVAHAVSLRDGGRQVFVATADGGLEMKLEDQGIPVLTLDDGLRLASEPDPEKARADGLERELRALRNRLPILKVSPVQPCLVRRQRGHGRVEDYVRCGLEAAEAAYREQQAERADRRHPGLVQGLRYDTIHSPQFRPHLAVAEQFLTDQHRWAVLVEGTAALRLTMHNAGNLTATDVRLRLFSPPHITMHGPGGFGAQPRRSTHPEAFSGVPVEREREDLAYYTMGSVSPGHPRVDRERGTAEFSWPRIQQHAAGDGASLWITAGPGSPLGRATMRFEILCEEIGGPQAGHLDVNIVGDMDGGG